MGNINGAKKDQNRRSRHEEKRFYGISNPRRGRDAGYKSRYAWHQPERVGRANSKGTNLNELGSATDGGIVGQLINEYRNQVASKKAEIQSIQAEVEQLESRIYQFETIQQTLKNQVQEVS